MSKQCYFCGIIGDLWRMDGSYAGFCGLNRRKCLWKLSVILSIESFRSENEDEDQYEFCPREVCYFVFFIVFVFTWFATLDWKLSVWRSLSCLPFKRVFKEKISCWYRNNSVYGWHTWRKRRLTDFWGVGNTKITSLFRFREDDFSSKFRCRRAADMYNEFLACVTCHGQLRMRSLTEQTNSHSISFLFSDLKLSNN